MQIYQIVGGWHKGRGPAVRYVTSASKGESSTAACRENLGGGGLFFLRVMVKLREAALCAECPEQSVLMNVAHKNAAG